MRRHIALCSSVALVSIIAFAGCGRVAEDERVESKSQAIAGGLSCSPASSRSSPRRELEFVMYESWDAFTQGMTYKQGLLVCPGVDNIPFEPVPGFDATTCTGSTINHGFENPRHSGDEHLRLRNRCGEHCCGAQPGRVWCRSDVGNVPRGLGQRQRHLGRDLRKEPGLWTRPVGRPVGTTSSRSLDAARAARWQGCACGRPCASTSSPRRGRQHSTSTPRTRSSG